MSNAFTDLIRGSQWQPIATAPPTSPFIGDKRNRLLLGSFPTDIVAVGNPSRLDRDVWTTLNGKFHAPTHWAKIPEPPK